MSMKLFDKIRERRQFVKSVKAMVKEFKAREGTYIAMTIEDLKELPDEYLYEAATERASNIVSSRKDPLEGFLLLSGAQKVIYIADLYDSEVQNGGLCQAFVNSSGMFANKYANALSVIGAEDHKALFEEFVAKNHIDLSDMSLFAADTIKEYQDQTERFEYDAFDDAYYELPPIGEYIARYARQHIGEI